jgi:hypothetical protein
MSPIDALECGMARAETKRRFRRLVNDSVFGLPFPSASALGSTGSAAESEPATLQGRRSRVARVLIFAVSVLNVVV